LLTFIALSFFSCSGGDDDANEVDPVTDPVPTVELGYPVTDRRYVAGTNIMDRKTEIFYK